MTVFELQIFKCLLFLEQNLKFRRLLTLNRDILHEPGHALSESEIRLESYN